MLFTRFLLELVGTENPVDGSPRCSKVTLRLWRDPFSSGLETIQNNPGKDLGEDEIATDYFTVTKY